MAGVCDGTRAHANLEPLPKLLRDVATNLTGQLALFAVGLVTSAFVFRRLGGDVLGLYYFALAVAAIATAVVDAGLSALLVRETAAHRATDPAYVLALHRTAAAIFWAGTITITAALAALAPLLIRRWVTLSTLDASEAVPTLGLFLVSGMLGLPRLYFSAMLRGVRAFRSANVVLVGTAAVQSLGAIALLGARVSSVGFAAWYAVAGAVSVVAAAVLCARRVGWRSLLPGVSTSVIRRSFSFLRHTAVTAAAANANVYADRLALSRFVGVAELSYYGVVVSLAGKARQLVGTIGQAALPSLSALRADPARADELRRQYRILDLGVAVATLPLFAAVVFATPVLLPLLFPSAPTGELLLPTLLLALGLYLNGVLNAAYQLSLACDHAHIGARANVLATVVVAPLTFALAAVLGLSGAATGALVYQLFVTAFCLPRFAERLPIGSVRAWLVRQSRVLLVGVSTFAPASAVALYVGSWWAWVAGFVVALAGYSCFAWFGLLEREARAMLVNAVRSRMRTAKVSALDTSVKTGNKV